MSKSQIPYDQGLLDILVCPISRTPLRYEKKTNELVSDAAKVAYPIIGGIPILLAEKARKLP